MARSVSIPRQHTLVLDGYNVLFAGRGWVQGFDRIEVDPSSAREALLGLLAGFQRRRSGPAWVVFDAREPGLADRQHDADRLHVTFAEPPQTGDDRVVQLVRQLDAGPDVTVVTDDRELQDRVRAEKARTAGSRAFLAQALETAGGPRPTPPPDMTTEDWLRYFGCEPGDEEGMGRP
jgi:predicted RNA-binding protein with PIN domain